jgi:hypothetical protein
MISVRVTTLAACVTAAGVFLVNPPSAQARCYTFQESHNGTDLFNPAGGAKTAATKKLMHSIEGWRNKRGIRKVRIGKVSTRCDPWNMKYILPHHRCYAKARVCY